MPHETLLDLIQHFAVYKIASFLRKKTSRFRPGGETLSHNQRDQFSDVMKHGEIKFADTSESKMIVVTAKVQKSLSERSGKKAQYDLGKKILAAGYYDAGIFVFYDTEGSFRFSLIYPQYIGRHKQWSNFRRFTYFVSPELTNKTFLTRVGDGDFSSLDKIKDAFSVEKVTKEFYEQYRKLFEALLGDLDKNRAFQIVASKNQINTPDFAKKLLGQVVFLYFLQKKGWLGVPQDKRWGDGDKNFISNLYKQAVKKSENFFNDYLEILFYDTLNNAHREGADPSFSRYFNCRIPFLNGGLFEPEYDWHGTKIYLENSVFKNIFGVFDRYNFTVEEESPDDKEVAVDPEMLGKVFENLLEENLRKGKGTYYTPREIVHYMCRESLVNYLVSQSGFKEDRIRPLILNQRTDFSFDEVQTLDRLLADIKACDPACGSGAFLVGMLNEIIHARLALDPAGSEYALKKETIQNCVYGVDIDPGAVEIAKLRLWLSLVVDYELADIEPLPNLDYKIMCGNSLLEELIVGDESVSLFDPGVLGKDKPKRKSSDKLMQMDFLKQDAEEYLKILRKLHVEYFHETDTQKKKTLRSRIEKIEMDFIQASVDSRVKEIDGRIKNLNMQKPEDRKKNAELLKKKLEYMAIPSGVRESKVRPYFLWHLNFFEVFQEKGGFDVLLANPPYIGQKGNKEIFQEIAKTDFGRRFHQRRMDLFYFFIHRSLDLGHKQTQIAFITTNYFVTATYADKLRKDLSERASIRSLVNFNELRIFESALGQHNMVSLFERGNNPSISALTAMTKRVGNATPQILNSIVSGQDAETEYRRVKQSDLYQGDQLYMTLGGNHESSSDPITAVLTKVARNGTLLGMITKISQGIVTGADRMKAKYVERYPTAGFSVGEGVFVLTSEECTSKQISLKSSHVRPWFKNSDIKKYWAADKTSKWLLYFKDAKQKQPIEEPVLKHFKRFEQALIDRLSVCEKNQFQWNIVSKWIARGEYYLLFYLRKPEVFVGEKIVAPQRSYTNTFGYNNSPWYASADVYFINSVDRAVSLKYVLAVLNSKLVFVWLYHRGKRKGEMLELYQKPLSEIPIKVISPMEQKPFIALVDKILAAKKRDSDADTLAFEREIDQMVYKLYGLTEEEIETVENSVK